jgi:hypothetical protein
VTNFYGSIAAVSRCFRRFSTHLLRTSQPGFFLDFKAFTHEISALISANTELFLSGEPNSNPRRALAIILTPISGIQGGRTSP